jgi:hypothetical protein
MTMGLLDQAGQVAGRVVRGHVGWQRQAERGAVAAQVVLFPAYFASGIEHLNVSLSQVSPLSNHTPWKAQVFYLHYHYFLFVVCTSAIPLCSSADQAYCTPSK